MSEKSVLNSKILVAEDDNSIRRLIEVTLKRNGAEVFSAEDGVEAMEILAKFKTDIIVADAMMPNMSGLELCRIVKTNPDLRKIPFIMLSGFNTAATDTDIKPDAYLTKDSRLMTGLVETVVKFLK